MTVVPWFEDFSVGDDLSSVPSVTVTEGYAAAHQMVFADRSRLALDWPLAKQVTGSDTALVNPSLVCNMFFAIKLDVTNHANVSLGHLAQSANHSPCHQ